VVSGLYLLYYFVVVDVNGESSTITDRLNRWQNRFSTQLANKWELYAIVLAGIVTAAVVFVSRRSRRAAPPEPR